VAIKEINFCLKSIMIDNITQEKQSADSKDPSMAQILQTIRGVITEDQATTLPSGAQDEVLELDKSLEVKPQVNVVDTSSAPLEKVEKPVDILSSIDNALSDTNEPNQPQEAQITAPKIEVSATNDQEADALAAQTQASTKTSSQLLSPASAQETAQSLRTLMKTLAKPASDGLAFRGGTTVEDLVTELMKPYLKEWLDKNLPTIVKQIVEKEIHKLIPQEDD
jgi:cell pole-organizing protein PopZ